MDIKEVKDLIQEILQSDISEFELEHTGTRIKLRRGFADNAEHSRLHPAASAGGRTTPSDVPVDVKIATAAKAPAEEEQEQGLHLITSPIVGTFYRAPSPGAASYVSVGSTVEEGTILCVVEAMKLMNEIPSDVAGELARIYVENGHPVEFGQKLFAIRPRR